MSQFYNLRQEYLKSTLDEQDLKENPYQQFAHWFAQAQQANVPEPNAMVLSTVDPSGFPDSRTVLIKEARNDGFVWFTNYQSAKAQQIQANPHASLLFFWQPVERQVRIKGVVRKITPQESDTYYYSRPVNSRLGAWSSPQSQEIANRQVIIERIQSVVTQYGEQPPRPDYWGGYILEASYFEFWQGRANRLHDRFAYYRTQSGWRISRLAP